MSAWEPAGSITKRNGVLELLKTIPSEPGLYRLTFESGAIYIGEASDLCRRLGDYLAYHPSTGIENEFRINGRLDREGGADIDIMQADEFKAKPARCQQEQVEMRTVRALLKEQGKSLDMLLNGGTLLDRISFHGAEVVRLTKRLQEKQIQASKEISGC